MEHEVLANRSSLPSSNGKLYYRSENETWLFPIIIYDIAIRDDIIILLNTTRSLSPNFHGTFFLHDLPLGIPRSVAGIWIVQMLPRAVSSFFFRPLDFEASFGSWNKVKM